MSRTLLWILLTPAIEELSDHPLLVHVVHLGQVAPLEEALLSGLLPCEGPVYQTINCLLNMLYTFTVKLFLFCTA